jgi:NaMN:DMB phosphoribosyltransferase
MMPVAAGIAKTYTGSLILAGGTQMLAVSAVIKGLGCPLPFVVTTSYVRDDPSANVQNIADQIGAKIIYVDPGFGDLGHAGLARYCIGEVKEGMGAGGAMCLAYLLGHSPDKIRHTILASVNAYC